MKAVPFFGLHNRTDYKSIFAGVTLGPLLSANLWRPQVLFNFQADQSVEVIFNLQRRPSSYYLTLDEENETKINAHFGLYHPPKDTDSIAVSLESQKAMRANTFRISWCHFDSTLFPFDRTFCFLGVSVERPRGDTIAGYDRSSFANRFRWAKVSKLSYRSNISLVLIDLQTNPVRRHRHRAHHGWPVTSDDNEWLQVSLYEYTL